MAERECRGMSCKEKKCSEEELLSTQDFPGICSRQLFQDEIAALVVSSASGFHVVAVGQHTLPLDK